MLELGGQVGGDEVGTSLGVRDHDDLRRPGDTVNPDGAKFIHDHRRSLKRCGRARP